MCSTYDRFLHSRSANTRENSPLPGLLGIQGTWTDTRGNIVKTRVENNEAIIINDLSATLEAHREKNRALTIRKVRCNPAGDFNHDTSAAEPITSAEEEAVDNTEKNEELLNPIDSPKERLQPRQVWPPDSSQYKALAGLKPGDKPSKYQVLEYSPVSLKPSGSWRLTRPVVSDISQWPWLASVESHDGDGHERLFF